MSGPPELRAEGDTALAEQLLAQLEVQRAAKEFARDAAQLELRRRLLSAAVRLTPRLTPDLHRVVDECVAKLGVEHDVELYVQPSPLLNAACFRPEAGRVFVLLSSELLEALEPSELAFVTGHELGHHVFGHHDLPVGPLLAGGRGVRAALALQLFAWSRYAEVSADRAGLYCADDLDAVARALFKLASGLRSAAAHVVMDALLAQVEALASFGAAKADAPARADWFSTHPFSPLRLKAVALFARSDVMSEGGMGRAELEAQVEEVMSIMSPGYLHGDSEEAIAMRRLLLAGAMLVAAASGEVDPAEVAAIEDLLGEGTVTRHLSVEALRADLPSRIRAVVKNARLSRRGQVMRDLCTIAKASGGGVGPAEREVLEQIAVDLGLGRQVVDCALEEVGAALD